MDSTQTLPPPQRQSSRPTSASSETAVTVHQRPSFVSHGGSSPRPLITGLGAKSPNGNAETASPFSSQTLLPDARRLSPETKRRSSAFYMGPESRYGSSEGNANLNRWSQSTASSRRSSTNYHRKSSYSKRLSGSIGSFAGFGSPQALSPGTISNKRPRSPPTLSPPMTTTISPLLQNPPPILPPIVTLSSLSKAVDAADSPSTVSLCTPATAELLSPSTNYTSEQDYFGDRWSANSQRKQSSKGKRASLGPLSKASPTTSPQSVERPVSQLPESMYSPRATTFSKQVDRRQSAQYRKRANSSKSGGGTTEGESSASDHRDLPHRAQRRRVPSQKALLSKALAKANHAVVLDGKQNVEGAILAYSDACNLLRQVMVRSSGEDDRRKLEAVRNTYKNRILELRTAEQAYASSDNKALPQRPAERDSGQTDLTVMTDEDDDPGPKSLNAPHDSGYGSVGHHQGVESPPDIPPRRQSLHSSVYRVEGRDMSSAYHNRYNTSGRIVDTSVHLQTPVYGEYMPLPLSPRRPLSPDTPVQKTRPEEPSEEEAEFKQDGNDQHTSWLNTINESSGSSASSVHSRRSSFGLRRKRIRAASGATEAEFDAALDAAIETAYDDGFEPDDEADKDPDIIHDPQHQSDVPDPLSNIRRNVELARENVREAEREAAISGAKERERMRLQAISAPRSSLDEDYGDDEGEEEERMLEEMTRDFVLDETAFDFQSKPALPRQSDFGIHSGQVWSGSTNPASSGNALSSSVIEAPASSPQVLHVQENAHPPPTHPPPSGALPPPPDPTASASNLQPNGAPLRPGFGPRTSSPGVRERRLSGMKAKKLKIETNPRPYSTLTEAPKTQPPPIPVPMVAPQTIPEVPQSAFAVEDLQQALPSPVIKELPSSTTAPSSRKNSLPLVGSDEGDPGSPTASAITKVTSADSDTLAASLPSSPARFPNKSTTGLRKNFSSSSLRSKSFSAGGDGQDASPNTSLSSISSNPKIRRVPSPAVPVLPTPLDTNFLPKAQSMGGIYLFDCDIHSPTSPGFPNPLASNAPLPLEPCPESSLLRPFWFLRAIYQTIAHPRGGYITSRLFVPRDIWRVKNLKLKNVEEKVSTCDLLTAALSKLGKVDTYNADAVLEEMQFLENVMERAQANLTKKLGNEVGVQGAVAAFKGVSVVDDSASNNEAAIPTSATGSSKSYLKSWRKLRSKNSLGPGLTSGNVANGSKGDLRDAPVMNSLPMTTSPNPRFPKRDVSQVQCFGPNPSYMGALARLCDAAQILDQIARQVEDPGLKHSSPTHVGLELCTRHAAEFFGFYICRFVFADIGVMVDKFIKRGSEWVLT